MKVILVHANIQMLCVTIVNVLTYNTHQPRRASCAGRNVSGNSLKREPVIVKKGQSHSLGRQDS